VLGETISDRLEIAVDDNVVVSRSVAELGRVYESALESSLRTEPEKIAAD
jgi:hypothetical protein